MASLKSCIGIHAAPPQIAAEIQRKVKDYKRSGASHQDAVESAIRDVQGTMRSELDAIHAQIKAANPQSVQQAQNPALTADQQQLADLKAAGLEVASWDSDSLDRNRMVSSIEQKLNGALTKEDIAQIIGTVESRYQFLRKRLTQSQLDIRAEFAAMGIDPYIKSTSADFMAMTPAERMVELVKAELLKSLTAKKEQLRVSWKSEQRTQGVDAAVNQIMAANPDKGWMDALRDFLVGDISGKGVVQSLQAAMKGEANMIAQATGLSKALQAFEHPVLGLRISAEDESLLATALITGSPSGSAKVDALAKAISESNELTRVRLNKAGANIGMVKGYVPQSWDRLRTIFFGLDKAEAAKLAAPYFADRAGKIALTEKARQAWVDFMLPRIDRQHRAYVDSVTGEYFDDARMRTFLENAFDTIATDGASKVTQSFGTGGLEGRLSAERQLFFKDAASYLEANNRFGSGDVLTNSISHIRSRAKDVALMETITDKEYQALKAKYEALDGKASGGFLRGGNIDAIWMELSGARGVSGTGLASRIYSGFSNHAIYKGLGAALLSQATDVPTFYLMAAKNGFGVADAVFAMKKGFNPKSEADRQAMHDAGIAVDIVMEQAGNRYTDTSNTNGITDKLREVTMRAGGMKWWTESLHTAAEYLVTTSLARNRNVAYGDLEPAFRTMLQRNGIDSANWDAIRSTPTTAINGREFLAPASVTDPAMMRRVFSMVADEADFLMIEPEARERAIILGESKGGSAENIFRKSAFMFKSFAVTMLTKVIPRLFANLEGDNYSYAKHLAAYSLTMMAMGAVSVQLKEMTKGRNPRDMHDPKFWIAALAQSGGMGIFGDYVFGDVNRFGQGVLATAVGGPLWDTATDLQKLTVGNLQELAQGKPTHATAEAVNIVKKNALPNLWYAKQAVDAIVFNRLLEAANPGYLRRMQSRVERENNTTFWWKPGDMLPGEAPDFSTAGGR